MTDRNTPLYERILHQDASFGKKLGYFLAGVTVTGASIEDPTTARRFLLTVDDLVNAFQIPEPDVDEHDRLVQEIRNNIEGHDVTTPIYELLHEHAPKHDAHLQDGTMMIILACVVSELDSDTQGAVYSILDDWLMALGIEDPGEDYVPSEAEVQAS